MSARDALIAEMTRAGIPPADPREISLDDRWRPYLIRGDRRRKGRYIARERSGTLVGWFGSWARGVAVTLKPGADHAPLSAEERAELRRQRARSERLERERKAAATALARVEWAVAREADDRDPYALAKRVRPDGLRQLGRALVVPLYGLGGELATYQLIYPDGRKLYPRDAAVKGNFHVIGELSDGTVILCEGWGTGRTIADATGWTTVCAMCAGNLLPVARALRLEYPRARILVAGDHDRTGTGQRYAREAAAAVDGPAVIPSEPGDFNDIHVRDGLAAVRHLLEART